jgi:hypothetical protein
VVSIDPSFESPTSIPSPEGGHPGGLLGVSSLCPRKYLNRPRSITSTSDIHGYSRITLYRLLLLMKKRKHFRMNQDSNTQTSVQFRLLKFSAVIVSLLASFCCRCRSGFRRRVVRRVVPGVSKDRSAFNFRVKDNLTLEMKAVRSSLTSVRVPRYAA